MPKQAKRPTRREKVEKSKVVPIKKTPEVEIQTAHQEETIMPEAEVKSETEVKVEAENKPGFFSRNKWIITSITVATAIVAGIAYAVLSGDSISSDSDSSGDQV